jgi:NhaP-type Na+/H+ or K+/H+ antiporter
MVGRIIWSSMVGTACTTVVLIAAWLVFGGANAAWAESYLAGLWAGALLMCGAFWRFGWRRSAARQLSLWGNAGFVGTLLLFAMVIGDVIPLPPTDGWHIAFGTTLGLGLGAALTASHIASRLRKEERSR